MATADVDADGDIDIVYTTTSSIYWLQNDGSENFTSIEITASFAGIPSRLEASDFDGDGDIDVVIVGVSSFGLRWYENDGSQNFTQNDIDLGLTSSSFIDVWDVDGNGALDVLANNFETDEMFWYKNDGMSAFTQQNITDISVTNNSGTLELQNFKFLDFDGDGDVDVLGHSKGLEGAVLYRNDGSENFEIDFLTLGTSGIFNAVPFDYDNDGDYDLLTINDSDENIHIYENTRTVSVTRAFPTALAKGDTVKVNGAGFVDGSIPTIQFLKNRFSNTVIASEISDNELQIVIPDYTNR